MICLQAVHFTVDPSVHPNSTVKCVLRASRDRARYPTTLCSGGEFPFETILIDAPLGDDPVDPAYLVITEPSQLEQLQGVIPDLALTAGNLFAGWDLNLILIVFSGVKGSSGYGIQIDSITAADNRWTVFVTETRPSAEQS